MSEIILETEDLTKDFAGFVAVNGVNLQVARGTIPALIKRVAADRTVLMVEHNLSVVENLCQRITVLTRGRVLAEGDYETVSRNSEVREAYLGTGDGEAG